MDEPNRPFDCAIGGHIYVRNMVNINEFSEDRKAEVCQMIQDMTVKTNQRKLIHQSMPLHMRRRAATHSVKRLPRRFRAVHNAQFSKSGVPDKKKRPSRKFRRKANYLQQEYERRKRASVWLETHIWHARRFHMVHRWGYRVAHRPCNKYYRAAYRATSRHCLVHDMSYEGCIEVRGDEATLKEGFRRLCSEKVGLTMAAKSFTAGNRAGFVWLYEDGAYPYRCLGRVRFLWRSAEDQTADERRSVWIFAHPTFYQKLVVQLVNVFKLTNAERETGSDPRDITQNPFSIRFPRYTATEGSVEVIELKDTINRFFLTGPLSQSVLSKVLKVYSKPEKDAHATKNWYTKFSKKNKSDGKSMLEQQASYWEAIKDLTSPGELSPGEVLALLVEDPRINRPKRRSKALPIKVPERYNFTVEQEPTARRPMCSVSPLWDETIRNRVTKEMKTMHELNQFRAAETLVPGERCVSEKWLQPVPVLLMQTPGSQDANFKRLGYGAGWELLVPAGYGLAMWHSLVLWGAKAAGQLEMDMLALESGQDRCGVPDTEFGRAEADRAHAEAVRRYFNLPNNKRINYTKLAIASPFRCPWGQLVQEWNNNRSANSSSEDQFYVLRDQDVLTKLKSAFERKVNISSIGLTSNTLVPLLLTLKTRGNPGDNGLICLPKREDLRTNKMNRAINRNDAVYTEPLRTDPNAHQRKTLRAEHLRTLKRLRSRRVREKKRQQRNTPGVLVRIAKPNNRALVEEQLRRMADLWIPARPDTVRNQCTRECFGYLTKCSFSLTEGKVTCIGYVTAKGLEKLFKICSKGTPKVLVRGIKSRNYRFASIRLLTQWS
ncbi:hypothetical protein ZHAS_00019358 [Anopheles sinensis]|uniref:Uncharacterized protein n=1 Tax=Anopheles sinensis TaxID=74873 RepID=A0A084WM62_ANOSI|nr:hypothetical protein ZHAS_00019358 [Anopheles sinensis]